MKLCWKSWVFILSLVSIAAAKLSGIDPGLEMACVAACCAYVFWYCYDSYIQYRCDCPGDMETKYSILLKDKLKGK